MFPQNQNELRFQHLSKINSGSLCFTIVPSFVDLELLTRNQWEIWTWPPGAGKWSVPIKALTGNQ